MKRKVVLMLVVGLLETWGLGMPAAAQSSTPDAGVPETNGPVYCVVQSGNRVYVGGLFTTIGGVSRNYLAAFDATTGGVDANWNPNLNLPVIRIAVSSGKVYAGGGFTTVNGGTPRNYLAAFNEADGTDTGLVDANWNPDMNGPIQTLAVSSGKVYAGGDFTTVNGGTSRNYLAAFNLANGSDTGTVDANWNPNLSDAVLALAVSGGKVYAGGEFTTVNGGASSRNGLAAFNLADGINTGTVDPNWNPNMGFPVWALAVYGGKVYVGGTFTTVNGGTARYRLAAFNEADGIDAGTADANWNPSMDKSVTTLLVSNDKVYAGGSFTAVNGGATPRGGLAAFNLADGADTGTALAWDPNAGSATYGKTIHSLAASASGVFAGGAFTTIGGNSKNYLAGFSSTVPVELSIFSVE